MTVYFGPTDPLGKDQSQEHKWRSHWEKKFKWLTFSPDPHLPSGHGGIL